MVTEECPQRVCGFPCGPLDAQLLDRNRSLRQEARESGCVHCQVSQAIFGSQCVFVLSMVLRMTSSVGQALPDGSDCENTIKRSILVPIVSRTCRQAESDLPD